MTDQIIAVSYARFDSPGKGGAVDEDGLGLFEWLRDTRHVERLKKGLENILLVDENEMITFMTTWEPLRKSMPQLIPEPLVSECKRLINTNSYNGKPTNCKKPFRPHLKLISLGCVFEAASVSGKLSYIANVKSQISIRQPTVEEECNDVQILNTSCKISG